MFIPFRHASVDYLHRHWNLLLSVAVLVYIGFTQSIYQTSIKEWMDSGAIGFVHQWVSVLLIIMRCINWSHVLHRMGGLVLERAVGEFSGFVVFQPIINGIGGNIVSVQASKISTMLHQSTLPGILPPHATIFELPWRALFHGTPYARTARILIMMSIPGQVLFIIVADYIHMSGSTIGAPFIFSYMTVSIVQVSL